MKVTEQLQIEQVPIGDLRPDPANPRRISDQELEALTRSIREFGLIDPIIARREVNTMKDMVSGRGASRQGPKGLTQVGQG